MNKVRLIGTKFVAHASTHRLQVLVVLIVSSSLFFFLLPLFTPDHWSPPLITSPQNPPFVPTLTQTAVAFPPQSTDGQRPLFPYSIIPRGVGTVQELRAALAHDPIAKAHYAGFNLANVHFVRAGKSRASYVSYRLGNQVFWTKNKLPLQPGELLISDGQHTARTRCGNRLSDSPMGPVSPLQPTAETLNTPSRPFPVTVPLNPLDPPLPWVSTNDLPVLVALSPGPEAPISPSTPDRGIFIPPLPPICCSGGGRSHPPVVPPLPIVSTLEPSTLLLLVIGLATAFLLKKR